ncbi:MAG: hypothetical protein ABI557_10010 [Aureliella sp.]
MRRWTLYRYCLLTSFFLLPRMSVGAGETIEWSGYEWNVTSSNGRQQGPGPNIFSDSTDNVFLDDEGNLHLRISKVADGKWHASQVTLTESLGYGTYQWEVSSRYDDLPSNVVEKSGTTSLTRLMKSTSSSQAPGGREIFSLPRMIQTSSRLASIS